MSAAILDTEFTSLLHPELLSFGLITLDGRAHYCEVDLGSEIGAARKRFTSVSLVGKKQFISRIGAERTNASAVAQAFGSFDLSSAEDLA